MNFFWTKVVKRPKMTRRNLLLKPNWNCRDICSYLECGKTKAYEYMRVAKKHYNGKVDGNSEVITRDSLLLTIGTSIEREIYILKTLKRKEAKNEETLQN